MGALQWEDYLVIAATLFISISIGIYYRFTGGRQKTMEVFISAIYIKHDSLLNSFNNVHKLLSVLNCNNVKTVYLTGIF